MSGFNGTFVFSVLTSPGDTPWNPSCNLKLMLPSNTPCPISYQYAIQHLGSGAEPNATQLSYTEGSPIARITGYDVGLYAHNDWRAHPSLTLSYGLRFEMQ